MKKLIICISLSISALVLLGQTVVINEFMASNDTTAEDEYGEFNDWVELYNNSAETVSLNGWYLSDDSSEPDKWSFPDLSISAYSYLIIWTDSDDEQGDNHANFKLSASGEEVVISDTNLNTIDEVIYGVQESDISYGRIPNGIGSFATMNPTFNAENEDEGSSEEDLSELLFDFSYVHKFDLQFYDENWADSLEYNYYNSEEYFPAQLTYNDTVVMDSIGVRYKGNSSYTQSSTTPKKPLKFRFDKYIDDQLLLDTERLNFTNCVKDPTFMREVIAYEIAGNYVPVPRTAYANIFVEDELLGFYIQVEQIDEIFLSKHYKSEIGNLYKASDDGATLLYRGTESTDYEDELEIKTNEDENDWSVMISMLDDLNNISDEDFETVMEAQLDLESCASMLAFNMVLSGFDSYTGSGRNFYLYHDVISDQFKFIPWDLNETFGCYNNNWNVITQDIIDISNLEDRPLNRRILQNSNLRNMYLEKILHMMENNATYDYIENRIAELHTFIEPYVLADENKLYSYDDYIANMDDDIFIGLGQVVPGLKSFVQERFAAIESQFEQVFVYPGDCDNNGIVEAADILPIGVYFLQTGYTRDEVSFVWQSNSADAWDELATTYADANGDGEVNEQDIIGIGVNWGNSHTVQGLCHSVNRDDEDLLNEHRETFQSIYNSLSDSNTETAQIKSLLNSLYQFSEESAPVNIGLRNYPNPFVSSSNTRNLGTTISFNLKDDVKKPIVEIYNIKGQLIQSLKNAVNDNGYYSVLWNGMDSYNKPVSSGIYFYKLIADGKEMSYKKMAVLK
jgi:spore coat protein CotH